jgi:hypothetical protein
LEHGRKAILVDKIEIHHVYGLKSKKLLRNQRIFETLEHGRKAILVDKIEIITITG